MPLIVEVHTKGGRLVTFDPICVLVRVLKLGKSGQPEVVAGDPSDFGYAMSVEGRRAIFHIAQTTSTTDRFTPEIRAAISEATTRLGLVRMDWVRPPRESHDKRMKFAIK